MKKICLILMFALVALGNCQFAASNAEDEKNFYAKVQNTGVSLCSSPSEASAMFEIPYSYFVKVDYVVDDFFKVSFNGLEGYVKKDKVSLMQGTPINPYPNASFKLFVPFALYESASQESSVVALDDTALSLKYYGTKVGQALRTDNNIWYYASVQVEDKQYFGYVFSGVTDLLTRIEVNNEIFTIVSEDALLPPSTSFTTLSNGTKVLLIVAISIPSLLILYFLIKPSKILQTSKAKKKVKKEPKRVRHGDYFEFDESEL